MGPSKKTVANALTFDEPALDAADDDEE